MASASVAQVLEALSALYSSTDPRAKKEATRWLEAFQKQPDAWAAADYLIKADNANMETRLFAAQTFRQKVVYDLRDLNTEARVSLRDSLVGLLTTEATRQKAIMVQLCLALADLAIQMPEWKTAVQDMVNKFGSTPETAACLLEFLTVLPEEIDGNNRLPLTDKEYKAQSAALLEQNAAEVMKLLIVYMQSSAGNTDLQEQVFRCLASWVRTGDVDINMFADSPLLDMTFEGLGHDMLFEAAVDLASEIIYETREVNNSKASIEKIYPRFEPLLPKLKMAKEEEDSDAVRGYCRLFVSAGEAYVSLIAKHPDTFRAIMEGIMECTAYQDLDIVPITFKFWYELTNTLTTESYAAGIPALSHYYEALVDIIIQHLHYPEDTTDWTAEQRDDFREFRHEMGDTLKDCCRVLSAERCLSKALVQLQTLLNQPEPASWQQIEAPIFSLRSMGSEVSEDENKVLPQILDLLSKLPEHPKIRYAATLVISRYSFWTRHHPQFITYQLNFISAGFQDAEVAAASALALKHLCKDCNELLIDYLSDLHPFYTSMIRSLPFLDALEVTEAVAHVLAVIPVNGLQNALQQFCLPLAQGLHSIASKEKAAATREDCTKAGDLLELISVFLEVIHPDVPLGQPHPCVNFVNELWPIFDLCLKNYGDEDVVCEQLGKCLRACVQSYGLHFVPMLPQLVERLVSGFEHSGLSVYLYVSSKIIREYAEGSAENASACFGLVERLSTTMFTMIREKNMNDIPDVVEDYFRMVTCLLERAPTHLVQSMLLPSVFQAGLAGLAMEESKALTAVVTFYRRLLGIALSVDELVPGDAPRTAAAIGQNGARIIELFKQFGGDFVRVLFDGLFYHYNWETIPDVATIIKSLAQILPAETSQWVVGIINSLSEDSVPAAERNDFLQQYMSAIQEKHWAKARRVLSDFIISYRRKNALRTGRE